jgi:hypothetical protein
VSRGRLRTILKWVIGLLGVLIALLVFAVIFKNPILKLAMCWNVKSSTGLNANIGKFDLDLGRSQLAISNFQIFNSPSFGNSVMLDIPEIYLALESHDAANGKIRFKEIRLNMQELHVVQNTNGITNLELLQKTIETNSAKKGHVHVKTIEFGGVDKIVVNLGKVKFTDLGNSANNVEMNLGVTNAVAQNLKSEEEMQNWATALLLRLAIQQWFDPESRKSLPAKWKALMPH